MAVRTPRPSGPGRRCDSRRFEDGSVRPARTQPSTATRFGGPGIWRGPAGSAPRSRRRVPRRMPDEAHAHPPRPAPGAARAGHGVTQRLEAAALELPIRRPLGSIGEERPQLRPDSRVGPARSLGARWSLPVVWTATSRPEPVAEALGHVLGRQVDRGFPMQPLEKGGVRAVERLEVRATRDP